jgi:hypothetical protein
MVKHANYQCCIKNDQQVFELTKASAIISILVVAKLPKEPRQVNLLLDTSILTLSNPVNYACEKDNLVENFYFIF